MFTINVFKNIYNLEDPNKCNEHIFNYVVNQIRIKATQYKNKTQFYYLFDIKQYVAFYLLHGTCYYSFIRHTLCPQLFNLYSEEKRYYLHINENNWK